MHAEIEHLTSVLRVWPDDKKYGDPYWGVVVRWINREEAELMLQQQKLTTEIHRAAMVAADKLGLKRILVRTYPDGAGGPELVRWLNVPSRDKQCRTHI